MSSCLERASGLVEEPIKNCLRQNKKMGVKNGSQSKGISARGG